MQQCPQTNTQSVYEHCQSVTYHSLQLIKFLQEQEPSSIYNYKLPDWFFQYKIDIFNHLLPIKIIEQYTSFHDCGKPYCITYDEMGKRHFPNHAEISAKTWFEAGGCAQTGELIKMDMMIHTIKNDDINSFIMHPAAITLLIVGLAEIHANAELFGGQDSIQFKIKWKKIAKHGKTICQKLFRRDYVID